MPATIVAIAITVDTPITTPRIVRPERPFAEASESNAEPAFSGNLRMVCAMRSKRLMSVGPHRGDGVETRGARRRVHAKDDSDTGAERERDENRPQRDARRQWRRGRNQRGESPTRARTQRPTEEREHHGLDEKLGEN